ncbi:MAG TPA: LLM class F420-dependent oxidoreductase [Thermomicrobiales bacterium]|jgi:F420-dependent oxidoreductase-like protein|nr:LLM class F420-dependent oxidoreductase [Thermomicrobiales bacterium]
MKVGLQVGHFTYGGGDAGIGPGLAKLARSAEATGFDSFWLMDHFFQLPHRGPIDDPMLEAYTALGFIAGATERIPLGTLVTGITYRHPGVLAKTVTTLDVLSGGRAWCGIGAAWFEREHEGIGVPFPGTRERFERLEETLRIIHQMWSDDDGAFSGTHYQLAETLCRPRPVSKPHPPIMVGGSGERKTLRLVAQYADACNISASAELPHKLDVLRRHSEDVGRDYALIEKTTQNILPPLAEGADGDAALDDLLRRLVEQADLGVDHAIISFGNAHDDGALERVARRIIEPARDLAVAGR